MASRRCAAATPPRQRCFRLRGIVGCRCATKLCAPCLTERSRGALATPRMGRQRLDTPNRIHSFWPIARHNPDVAHHRSSRQETPGKISLTGGSNVIQLAEPGGFEPPVEFNPDPSLAVKSVRPLRHGSVEHPRARHRGIGNRGCVHPASGAISFRTACGPQSRLVCLHSAR